MIRWGVVAVVACYGLTLLPGVASAQAVGTPIDGLPDGVGIRLLDVPADREDDPRARSYVIDHLIPGATIERTILVTNGTDEPMPITMDVAPATTEDGWVVQSEVQNPPDDSLAAWVAFDPAALTIAPQSGAEVEVEIAVPPGVPPGERYAALIAEPPPVQQGAVGSVGRVGIRVYLSVGGDEPVTDFQIDTLIASRDEEGVPSVEVGVLNIGGRAIDVSGQLELESVDGLLSAGPFPTAIPRTLGPRSRGSVLVPLPESLGEGPWEVTATMRSGLVERVATTTLTIPDEPGTSTDPADSETIGGTDAEGNDISERLRGQRRALLPLAAIMVLLALGALWLMLMWKRRDEDEDDEEGGDGASAEAVVGAGGDDDH